MALHHFLENVLIMVAKKTGMLTDDATFVGVFGNNIFLCFSSFYVPRWQEIYYQLTLIYLLLVNYQKCAELLSQHDVHALCFFITIYIVNLLSHIIQSFEIFLIFVQLWKMNFDKAFSCFANDNMLQHPPVLFFSNFTHQ